MVSVIDDEKFGSVGWLQYVTLLSVMPCDANDFGDAPPFLRLLDKDDDIDGFRD